MLAVYIYNTFDIYVVCIDYLVKKRGMVFVYNFLFTFHLLLSPLLSVVK